MQSNDFVTTQILDTRLTGLRRQLETEQQQKELKHLQKVNQRNWRMLDLIIAAMWGAAGTFFFLALITKR